MGRRDICLICLTLTQQTTCKCCLHTSCAQQAWNISSLHYEKFEAGANIIEWERVKGSLLPLRPDFDQSVARTDFMCNCGYVVGSTCRWSSDATGWHPTGLWVAFTKGRGRKNHYEDEKKVWHLRFRGQQNWGTLVEFYLFFFLFSNYRSRRSVLAPGGFDVIIIVYK